jgi:uncharacterized lipoprotein YmbA
MRGKTVVHLILSVISAAAVLLAVGCVGTGQSPQSRFYMLSSLDQTEFAADTPAGIGDAGIVLGPIRFPAYLSPQKIVTRTSPNKIQVAEFDRWAEPLETSFLNVLRENLSILLNTAYIVEPPVPKNAGFEFQVVAGVSRFDAEPGKQVVLTVRWMVIRVEDNQVLKAGKSTYTSRLGSDGFEEIVKAQSGLVADFSREVTAAVQELYRIEHGQ